MDLVFLVRGRPFDIFGKRQEDFLSWYGPFSLVLLLIFWATGLVVGFGLVHWASGSIIKTQKERLSFGTYLYLSGTTFFTLGLGDVILLRPSAGGLSRLKQESASASWPLLSATSPRSISLLPDGK